MTQRLQEAYGKAASANAWQSTAQFLMDMPDRRIARETAKMKQQQSQIALESAQLSLAEQKATQSQRMSKEQQAITLLMQQNKELLATSAKNTAYSAFDRYTSTGNIKHMNNLLTDLKSNPMGARLMPDVIRMDQVQQGNPQDLELLARNGFVAPDEFFTAEEDLANRFVKVTLANGQTELRDLATIYAGTGYSRHVDDRDMEQQLNQSLIAQRLKTGTGGSSQLERIVAEIKEADPDISDEDAYNKAQMRIKGLGTAAERQTTRSPEAAAAVEEAKVGLQVPVEEREQRIVDESKDSLNALAGGDFTTMDLDNIDVNTKSQIDRDIRRIEKVGGYELSIADRKSLQDISQLTAMGSAAAEMTSAETGVFDRMFNTAKSYVSDEVGGKAATSAYHAFRNTVRNALFGSALTEAEITSFNEAFGTLGQQAGPVMQQFVTSLNQVKAKLETIYATNDEHVIKYRTGKSLTELEDMIYEIEERVSMFQREAPTVTLPEQTVTTSAKPSIGSYFGQGNE